MSTERLKEVAFAQNTNLGIQELDENDMREWSDYFFNKSGRIVNPCDNRLEVATQRNEPVQYYGIVLQSIEGIMKRLQDPQSTVRAQMTFFDDTYKQFFGLTWKGPTRVVSDNIHYDESVYFCSSILDEHVLCVVELVEKSTDRRTISLGWTAFRPFISNPSGDLNKRLSLYAGTPRALFFVSSPFEKHKDLVELQGIYLNYSFSEKPRLEQIKKYLPENVFLGRLDKIGGIVEVLPKHCLDKPRLNPQLSVIIDDLFVHLNPNVTRFEAEFTQLLAEDKSFWDRIKIEPSMVSIYERRLKIGVHNGWRYLHEPFIVQLGVDDPTLSKSSLFHSNRRLSLKTSLKPKTSDPEMAMQANRLVMRNSLVLDEIFEDPMCAIVFVVEYIVTIPIQFNLEIDAKNKKDAKSGGKKQVETHSIMVRWGAFCPYATGLNEDMKDGRVEINMFGTASPNDTLQNPENRLVFKRPDTDMQDEYSSRMAPGRISFNIKKGTHVNFRQPKFDDTEQIETQTRLPMARYDDMTRKQLMIQTNSTDLTNQTQKSIHDLYSSMMARQDENLQTPQGNLLMSQLMRDRGAADSQRLLGVFGGNLELYPVYNPSFHMPILALTPGQIGGRTMSRAAYAKLQSAKFPPIKDRFDKEADVIDGSTYINFNLQKEEDDGLTCNQVIFQFLAFSRTLESMRESGEPRPKNVYFTFQFYRFPEFKTPKLKLDRAFEDYSTDSYSTPFILKYVDTDRNGTSESPGYMISYDVDPTVLKYGEKRIFLEYLANHAMFVDVWDGDSLHLIGTATLQLKELLRQGKEAVQSMFELDVISVEYDDDSRLYSGNTFKDGAAFTSDSHVKLRGILHMRIGNIGSPVTAPSDPINQTSLAPYIPFTRVVASKTSMNSLGQQLMTKRIDETTPEGFLSHHISTAHHMADTFKDIHVALASKNNKNLSDDSTQPNLDALRKRKLHRMEIARKLLQNAPDNEPLLLGHHKRVIQDRKKDLRIMEFYRNQTKHDQIMNKLHEFITTEYAIYPNFGIVEFFEFVLTNPYSQPQTVTIIVDDPDLQVVTNSHEWRHLKLLHQIYTPVEDNLFHRQAENVDGGDGNPVVFKYPQIFLRPKETINIPFKYQTFRADNRVVMDEAARGSYLHYQIGKPSYDIKKVVVYFRAEDRNPIAILRLVVDQQPHVVNQTFRFNECENSFLKKTIRLPASTKALASRATVLLSGDIKLDGTIVDRAQSQLYVRSSDPSVVCDSHVVTVGEPHDVYFKAPTGVAPTVSKFFIAIYADQFLAVPLQVWQVYVHSLQRIDVACSLGQTSRFSLILKGTQSSRLVKAYSSSPEEMSVVPEDKFMLAASAVQEVNAGVQPIRTGAKHFYLNIVDVEQSTLVHSWFINVNCKPPVITKTFELTLSIAAATSSSLPSMKRVSFTNPYATERVFVFATNRDDLLTFKERRIKFSAGEQKTLALRFLPNPFTGFVEIYVFINNENDTNEETFALRVHYVKQLN